MLSVVVNGVARECAPGASVEALLIQLDLPADRVAVERNRQIVRRDQRAGLAVEEGDIFEIVTFVGGG